MIVASAIKLESNEIYVGKRHSDCFRNYISIHKDLNEDECKQKLRDCIQGFITSDLEFLTREEAFTYASLTWQLDKRKGSKLLTSEDLW